MTMDTVSRRLFLKQMGAAGALACSTGAPALGMAAEQPQTGNNACFATDRMQAATREQRMAGGARRNSKCSSTGGYTAR